MINSKLLKLGHFNAGSLNSRQNEFIVAAEHHDLDILSINETWLKEGEDACAPVLSGYKFRHTPRRLGARKSGGGVGFYIRKGINVRCCAHIPSPNIEQMWLKFTITSKKIIIGTAYRPQWVNCDVFLDSLGDTIATFSDYDYLILTGDFNINLLEVHDPKSKRLTDFLYCMHLNNYVTEPTHFTKHSSSLIDLLCSNVPLVNVTVDYIPELGGHAMVTCELKIRKEKPLPRTFLYRNIKNINMDNFNSDLLSFNWEALKSLSTVDEKIFYFNSYLLSLFDAHAPERIVVLKNKSKPWLTENVRLMMRLRNEAHYKYRISGSESDKALYKNMKHLVNSSIFYEQKAYFENKINKNISNSKKLWKNLKSEVLSNLYTKPDIPDYLRDPDQINKQFLTIPGDNSIKISTLTFFEFYSFSDSSFDLSSVSEEDSKDYSGD